MGVVFSINTNIISLITQRYLALSNVSLDTAMQRLSSGLRVNGAADDASGLAIADNMKSIVQGQTVAIQNANDAVSYSQVVEGALSSITGILQKMRNLALESANYINSDANRVSLNSEFVQLQTEIDQITHNTQFNGQEVLNGGEKVFQIGSGASSDNQISIQGTDLTSTTSYTGSVSFVNNGVTENTVNSAAAAYIAGGGTFSTADGQPNSAGSGDLSNAISQFANNIPAAEQTKFNNAKSAFISEGGSFSATDGSPVMAETGTATISLVIHGQTVYQQVPAYTQADINAYNNLASAQTAYNAAATGVQILDQSSSLSSINAIDNALGEIDKEQSQQGAFQNRLKVAISNLQSSVINQSAAESRIMDANFATETSDMARSLILQKAGSAMLAQANTMSGNVLSLLH